MPGPRRLWRRPLPRAWRPRAFPGTSSAPRACTGPRPRRASTSCRRRRRAPGVRHDYGKNRAGERVPSALRWLARARADRGRRVWARRRAAFGEVAPRDGGLPLTPDHRRAAPALQRFHVLREPALSEGVPGATGHGEAPPRRRSWGLGPGDPVEVRTAVGTARFLLEVAPMRDDVVSVDYGWWRPEGGRVRAALRRHGRVQCQPPYQLHGRRAPDRHLALQRDSVPYRALRRATLLARR